MKYSPSGDQVEHLEARHHLISFLFSMTLSGHWLDFPSAPESICSTWHFLRGRSLLHNSDNVGVCVCVCVHVLDHTLTWDLITCWKTCLFLFACVMNLQSIFFIQPLTVHLFVSVTAPWWLLFSPSWGDKGEAKNRGRLVRKCVMTRLRSLYVFLPSGTREVAIELEVLPSINCCDEGSRAFTTTQITLTE